MGVGWREGEVGEEGGKVLGPLPEKDSKHETCPTALKPFRAILDFSIEVLITAFHMLQN